MMFKKFGPTVIVICILSTAVLSLPIIFTLSLQYVQKNISPMAFGQFPVTVDPKNKTIVESDHVNAFFENPKSPFQAAVKNTDGAFWNIFGLLATTISKMPLYQNIAGVAGAENHFVTITPGMRKEQVANAFALALKWNNDQKLEFMTADAFATLPLSEGSFSPGIYSVVVGTTPSEAQALVNSHFTEEILSHYGTATSNVVPLEQALTIASLIEREAGGADDMRIISGIIWNRLFANMKLQIDATLQYTKASNVATGRWWPKVVPADMYRESPYNTYINKGLPPTPIANPSVASVLAALNPKNTTCMFYFHDNAGQFHCTDTYAEHVALLKKYFGRGK